MRCSHLVSRISVPDPTIAMPSSCFSCVFGHGLVHSTSTPNVEWRYQVHSYFHLLRNCINGDSIFCWCIFFSIRYTPLCGNCYSFTVKSSPSLSSPDLIICPGGEIFATGVSSYSPYSWAGGLPSSQIQINYIAWRLLLLNLQMLKVCVLKYNYCVMIYQ